MAKRDTIGGVVCPHCSSPSEIRKNIKGKLYYCCPKCGLIQGTGESFQEYILVNGTMHGAASANPPEAAVHPVERKPEPAAEPAPKRSSWGFF